MLRLDISSMRLTGTSRRTSRRTSFSFLHLSWGALQPCPSSRRRDATLTDIQYSNLRDCPWTPQLEVDDIHIVQCSH